MQHVTADFPDRDEDGWCWATCSCGHREGPFPDLETMVDALMDHAYRAALSGASS